MAYADLNTIQSTDPGDVLTAAWCDQSRDNQEFLIDPPSCSVFNSSAQSVADVSDVVLTADSENFDNDSMHSTGSNTSRITAQTAGRYLCFAVLQFEDTVDAGILYIKFQVDGSTKTTVLAAPPIQTSSDAIYSASLTLVLAASSYVECVVRQTGSGSAKDVTLLEFSAFFMTR